MRLPLKWEFPGGKIEPGETPEVCLKRELVEELEISVIIEDGLEPVTHAYDGFTVTLYPFVCGMEAGKVVLHEHAASAWLRPADLLGLDWAEADRPVLSAFLKMTGLKEESPL
jgi:8-oxo-dGTP diphosphatase